jgi:hypothetical protein
LARIAIIFGVLLAVLGIGLYAMADPDLKPWRAMTALIPTVFGAVLIVIGQFAQSDSPKVRMHSMHAAALVGLIGLAGGTVMTLLDIQKRGSESAPSDVVIDGKAPQAQVDGEAKNAVKPPSDLATGGKAALAVLCGVFLALCVKSFIDVRRARKQQQAAGEPVK